MKRFLVALFCLLPIAAYAGWQSRDSNYNVSIGGSPPPSYTGPGDIVSGWQLWVGLRAYSAGSAGSPSVNVCNPTDAACSDLSTDAATGALVITPIGGHDCSANDCTIKIWYDQSGAGSCGGPCDMTQAIIVSRPLLITNCIGALPCARFAGGQLNANVAGLSQAQPLSISYAANRTGATSARGAVLASATGGQPNAGFEPSANLVYIYAGGSIPTQAAADGSFHAVQNIFNGASSSINVDGSSTGAVSPGTTGISTGIFLGNDGFNSFLTGDALEAGLANGSFSGGDQSAINSNQRTFWGF